MQPVSHLQDTQTSYIREILGAIKQKDIISLAGGLPCPSHFPMDDIAKLAPAIANDPSLYQYSTTAGFEPLLAFLREDYGLNAQQELLITNGAQQGIDLCARAFLKPGDKVVVESPSYLGALQIFSIAKANIISVEQLADGPDLNQLEACFAKGDIRCFYGIPDFHNPTGCCWSLDKRQKIAKLCRQYQVIFIEDAPYRALRFSGQNLPMVSSFCAEQAVVLYSFSKTVSPGLRLGALVSPRKWSRAFYTLKQACDLHSPVPTQKLLLELLRSPNFKAHTQAICESYQQRYHTLSQALSCLPTAFSHHPVEGGMFIWLSVPQTDTLSLANKALSNGVAVVPGSEFYQTQEPPSRLRLNFSYHSSEELLEGVKRLLGVLLEQA